MRTPSETTRSPCITPAGASISRSITAMAGSPCFGELYPARGGFGRAGELAERPGDAAQQLGVGLARHHLAQGWRGAGLVGQRQGHGGVATHLRIGIT